jgi:hypothetical protein
MTYFRLCWVCSLALALVPGLAAAQSSAPYSTVDITASALHSPPRAPLANYYTGGSGYALDLALPLPVGVATLTGASVPYHGMLDAYRNFTATEALLGWELALPLNGRVSARAGVRAGEFMMAFDDTIITPGLRDEKELMLGVTGEAAVRIAGRWSVAGHASWDHVYLHVPTHFLSLQAGLRYTASLPDWVQEFLR